MSRMSSAYRDGFLYLLEPGSKSALTTFFNLVSNAVTYGMVMGSARTGLGTDNPTGKSIPGPSLYYQALQAYSAFDWEFQRQLEGAGECAGLPKKTLVLAGRFPRAFLEELVDEELEEVATAQRISSTLVPSLEPFAFRTLPDGAESLSPDGPGPEFSREVQDALWQGSRSKLEGIARNACSADSADLETKLTTMASAFAPLCTTFGASFCAEPPDSSYSRLSVYLPAIHTLHADDMDDPSGWYLERGIPALVLPAPVQVSAARIDEMSYLRDAAESRMQGIKLEVRRDFRMPHSVTMVLSFGRFFAESSDDLMGLDCSEHQDALHLGLRGHLPILAGDGGRLIAAKQKANELFAGFAIQARIHALTLHLVRDDDSKAIGEEQLLRPQFSLEESKISFRIERRTASKAERISLQAAGFSWEEAKDGESYLCWREFYTWDRLREFFGGEATSGQGLGGLIVTGREKLLGQGVGRATQLVLDHSIESIEDSLDREIARLVGESLERYATAREVLAGRLHEGLF